MCRKIRLDIEREFDESTRNIIGPIPLRPIPVVEESEKQKINTPPVFMIKKTDKESE